ncbi:MAG: hypothetical protein DPW09_38170 [Anaerolineae bacterium]|nr:hypothetical protein [Anaerolineae bacterium]
METVLSNISIWLPGYWVGATVVRLILSVGVVLVYGRSASLKRPSAIAVVIGLTSAFLVAWVLLALYLGNLNFFQINRNTPLPPPIGAATLIPVIIGYLAFRYSATFRQVIFKIPQSWMIGLQAYRVLGGVVFLILYGQGLMPGVFALPAGIGDTLTGGSALLMAYVCYKQTPWSRKAAVLWNWVALIEMLMLVPLGILSSPSRVQILALDMPNFLTTAWPTVLAPTFHVPLGLLMHIYSLAALKQEDEAKAAATSPSLGWLAMLFSAIAIVVYVIFFYLLSPLVTTQPIAFQIYPGLGQVLAAHPVGLYLHIIPATLALLLGPLQFLPSFRNGSLNRHYWIGRTYLLSILLGGLGALYIAQFSFAGLGSQLGFSAQAILLLFTGYMAYTHIRQRRIDSHQEWMIRNYALVFGAVTLRLNIRLFFWLDYDLSDFHAFNAWLCWIPNLMVAEWLIYRLRARRSQANPALQATSSRP